MSPWANPRSVMIRFRRKKKIWMSCAFAKASTRMPGRLVIATPANTYTEDESMDQTPSNLFRHSNYFQVWLFVVLTALHWWLLTALPILAVASLALSMWEGWTLSANDLVIWETNSTEMPTACRQHRKVKTGWFLTKAARLFNGLQHNQRSHAAWDSYRHQVDESHRVVINPPQRHDPHSVHHDHYDGDQVEQAGANVQAEQQAANHKGGEQTQRDVEEPLRHDGQVLLIKHVGHPGRCWHSTTSASIGFKRRERKRREEKNTFCFSNVK